MYKTVNWNTGSAAARYRLKNKKNKKPQAPSFKQQAASLTGPVGDDRMNLERNNMDTTQLKRIADALEEILRLVKEDQEKMRKIRDE